MKQEKIKIGFEVIMKDKTSQKETNSLIEEILKNKFVKNIKGTIFIELKIKKKTNRKKDATK